MKTIRKISLFATSAAIIAAPIATTISCGSKGRIKISYDFGLATEPINSLNYIRFKNTAKVVPSMIEGVLKTGSTNKILQSQLGFPKMDYFIAKGSPDAPSTLSGVYYDLKDTMGVLPGSSISSVDGNPILALASQSNANAASMVGVQLNSDHYWSNGDNVTAQDYIDTIKYILDINTGSQYLIDVQESGIKNANKMVALQREYYKKYGAPYNDPFGYDGWESQNNGDDEDVKEIRDAALGLGIFTKADYKTLDASIKSFPTHYDGNTIDDYHKNVAWYGSADNNGSTQSPVQNVSDDHLMFYEFEESNQPAFMEFASDLTSRAWFLPTNRSFVEATGGIQKFGIDKDHFLWNSAFKPEELYLGPAGYILLKKDEKYYNSARTVSSKVKIFFQSDPMVLASMFEDGYISDVHIPATHQQKFWADLNMRQYMKKAAGFGTQAFAMNLSTGNEALQDDNFRKAIAFALDRQALARVASEETSFPVTTWTAFGQVHDAAGIPLEKYFDGQTYQLSSNIKTADGKLVELPIQSYSYTDHDSKANQFENVDRTDIGYNEAYAKTFMAAYRAAHPSQGKITLRYVYDGNEISKNIGIYLKSQLNFVFGGQVDVDIQGVPSNVFESFKDTGNFDIIFYNYDSYGSQLESYVKRFFIEDSIDKTEQKTTGFKENPSGGWTYKKWFEQLAADPAREADVKARLQIKPVEGLKGDADTTVDIWNLIKELSTPQTKNDIGVDETNDENAYQERYMRFFNSVYGDKLIDSSLSADKKVKQAKALGSINVITAVVSGLEKIIRETMPIIPLMEVDTYWEAQTLGGVDSLYAFSLQTAYNVLNKPLPILPGIEKE